MKLEWIDKPEVSTAKGGNSVYPEEYRVEKGRFQYWIFGEGRFLGTKGSLESAKKFCEERQVANDDATPKNLQF